MVKHNHDTEIGLLQKEKSQLDMCVVDLKQERSSLESKLEKRQNVILRLQSQLSTLQCELDELKAEYEKLADDSIIRTSDLTDTHEKEIANLRDYFAKEREELLIANETLKSDAETKVREVEDTNSFLTEELRDVQRLYKDVRMAYVYYAYYLSFLFFNYAMFYQIFFTRVVGVSAFVRGSGRTGTLE